VVDTLGGEVIHAVDMLRYLAGGKVIRTSSTVAACDSPVPNAWNALLTFDGGAVGVLQSNWNVGGRCHTYQVHSVGYSAFVEPQASLLEITRHDRRAFRTAAEVMGADDAADPRKLQGYYQQARHFVDCIQERRQPSTCFSDYVETMRVLDAIRAGFTM
jgi:predicted dehydrogenase